MAINIEDAAKIRKEISVPVTVVGSGYIRAGGTVYCGRKGRYGFYGARTDGRSDGG